MKGMSLLVKCVWSLCMCMIIVWRSLIPRLSARSLGEKKARGGGIKESLVSTVCACVKIHRILKTSKLAVFLRVHFVLMTR